MYLVDHLHQRGIGVILDWVPSHFPTDEHGLGYFDGTHLYEHADPRLGLPPRLEQPDLQLRPPRGARVPAVERAALARPLPRRRPPGRCRGVDALPRLLPQGRRVDPQRARRQREPRRAALPQAAQRDRSTASSPTCRPSPRSPPPGRWCRGPTSVGGLGFGFKWDMGWMHDTLAYLERDPIHRPPPPGRAHVPRGVRVHRELRAAALPRRGRARQGLAARQDARRRVAAARQPAPALRLPVRPARQEAAVHGRASWPRRTSGTTTPSSAGSCSTTPATRACARGWPTSTPCTATSRRCTSATSSPPASSGSTPATPAPASSRSCGGRPATASGADGRPGRAPPAGAGRGQLHPGAAPGLRHRRAHRRPVARAGQQRRRGPRRIGLGEPGRRRRRRSTHARSTVPPPAGAPATRGGVPHPR